MTFEPTRIARPASSAQLCVTVRRNDHTVLNRLIAEGRLTAHTLLFDARSHERHQALREEARAASHGVWLDTQGLELSLPSGVTDSHLQLPWAKHLRHPQGLNLKHAKIAASLIASFALAGQYSAILVPTHYLADEQSGWLEADAALTAELHDALEAAGGRAIQLIYPLTLHTKLVSNRSFLRRLARQIANLPVNQISLRLHPFGANAGPNILRRLIEGLAELRAANLPLLIERSGFAGQLLYAMGVVDGVESGIAIGDTYDLGDRLRTGGLAGSGPTKPRVYFEALGRTVDVAAGRILLASGMGKTRFACRDPKCCADGAKDMLRDPRRHSLLARQRQLAELEAVPASERPEYFVQRVLTPVCDSLSRASHALPTLLDAHRRALSVKETLKSILAQRQTKRRAAAPVPPTSGGQVLQFPNTRGRAD